MCEFPHAESRATSEIKDRKVVSRSKSLDLTWGVFDPEYGGDDTSHRYDYRAKYHETVTKQIEDTGVSADRTRCAHLSLRRVRATPSHLLEGNATLHLRVSRSDKHG